MFPPKRPMQPTASPNAAPMGDKAVLAFRKALGVPEDQPAPEKLVIDAVQGKMGQQVKQMAMGLAAPMSTGKSNAGMDGQNPGDGVPSTKDPGMPGGTEPNPPEYNSDPNPDSKAIQPGASTAGKMGSATIFGREPVNSTGDQDSTDDEEEDDPRASAIFGRR